MVAPAVVHGAADGIGLAVMGVRGIHDLGNIIENGEESEEEKREREARHAGEAVGVLVGGAVGFAIGFVEKQTIPAEDVDDGEDEGFEISM